MMMGANLGSMAWGLLSHTMSFFPKEIIWVLNASYQPSLYHLILPGGNSAKASSEEDLEIIFAKQAG